MRWLIAILGLVLVYVVARMTFYTVDAGEYAYVAVLGRHSVTHDGGADGAGLHLGWPWPFQTVQRLDRRLQFFDMPAQELLMPDATGKSVDKNLAVEGYVCWRIADVEAVDRFVRRLGTAEQARSVLGNEIASQLGGLARRFTLSDFVSVSAGAKPGTTHVDQKIAELESSLASGLKEALLEKYGVELVDVRLRRYSYAGQVRESIFARIRSERDKKAKEYQAKGTTEAANINTDADEKVRRMLAEARYEEAKKKSEADAEALRLRNQAHAQDPGFYAFLKQMDNLQSILGGKDSKTVLLLSTNRPLFELLFQPPRPNGSPPAPGSSLTAPGKKDEGPPVSPRAPKDSAPKVSLPETLPTPGGP